MKNEKKSIEHYTLLSSLFMVMHVWCIESLSMSIGRDMTWLYQQFACITFYLARGISFYFNLLTVLLVRAAKWTENTWSSLDYFACVYRASVKRTRVHGHTLARMRAFQKSEIFLVFEWIPHTQISGKSLFDYFDTARASRRDVFSSFWVIYFSFLLRFGSSRFVYVEHAISTIHMYA